MKSWDCAKCSEGTPNAAEKVVDNRKKVEKKKSTKSKYINNSCCILNAYYVFGILSILHELIWKQSYAIYTIIPILSVKEAL